MTSHSDDKKYELALNQDEFDVTVMAVQIALEDAKVLANDSSGIVPLKEGLVESIEEFLEVQAIAEDNVVHLTSVYNKLIAEGGEEDDDRYPTGD